MFDEKFVGLKGLALSWDWRNYLARDMVCLETLPCEKRCVLPGTQKNV